jgi:hypothetical protein
MAVIVLPDAQADLLSLQDYMLTVRPIFSTSS